jgi:hypothetical protein
MKAYWGVEVYLHSFLDLGTRCRWVVSFTHRQLYPQGKRPWYPLDRRPGGSQMWQYPIIIFQCQNNLYLKPEQAVKWPIPWRWWWCRLHVCIARENIIRQNWLPGDFISGTVVSDDVIRLDPAYEVWLLTIRNDFTARLTPVYLQRTERGHLWSTPLH